MSDKPSYADLARHGDPERSSAICGAMESGDKAAVPLDTCQKNAQKLHSMVLIVI